MLFINSELLPFEDSGEPYRRHGGRVEKPEIQFD